MVIKAGDEGDEFEVLDAPLYESFQEFFLSDKVSKHDIVTASILVIEHPEISKLKVSDILEHC